MAIVETRDLFGNKYKVDESQLEIKVHVYGIAINDKNEVLISPQYDGYDFPGGKLKQGETTEQALTREVKEETGLMIGENITPLKEYISYFHNKGKDFKNLLRFYKVEIVGGEISTEGFSESEKQYAAPARWVNVRNLITMKHACNIDIAYDLLQSAFGVGKFKNLVSSELISD